MHEHGIFGVGPNRIAVEFLLTAATPFALAEVRSLLVGTALGVTGMASAFREAAGCGSLDLTAVPADGGYRLSGTLRWADLEIRTADGKGYASRTPTSRRYREAAFIPVQSQSEAQLRWELGRCA